ncbi:MAG: hypothetical protein MZV63_54440 [Marinilabiliales bacterium]|nr:hypothetical protein [Marinilabiliales bacterium]
MKTSSLPQRCLTAALLTDRLRTAGSTQAGRLFQDRSAGKAIIIHYDTPCSYSIEYPVYAKINLQACSGHRHLLDGHRISHPSEPRYTSPTLIFTAILPR